MLEGYQKAKLWNGKDLEGVWTISLKIDGVRMLRNEKGQPVSRNGKRLYGLDHVPADVVDAEIFGGDWERSISLVKRHDSLPVHESCVYSLSPVLDKRLFIENVGDPDALYINNLLEQVVADGHEGLILRERGGKKRWLKVKPHETFDVPVTDIQMGTGKHTGRVGALITPMGKVGTGFTDEQRTLLLDAVGKIIEVECMQLTPAGKFRHPRFIRVREDK